MKNTGPAGNWHKSWTVIKSAYVILAKSCLVLFSTWFSITNNEQDRDRQTDKQTAVYNTFKRTPRDIGSTVAKVDHFTYS